jgi:hypothetical protein
VVLPSEHFLVVTMVSVLAVGVALLVVRTAHVMEQYQVLLIAAVHALVTPGAHGSNMPMTAAGAAADAATPRRQR